MFREKLESKKNEVYKRERFTDGEKLYVVEKEFRDEKNFYIEYILHDILSKNGLSVPRLLDFEPPAGAFKGKLVYEFLEGDVALEALGERDTAQDVIVEIIIWMERFYEITAENSGGERWVLGDIHLRNFIYDKDRGILYGFDFEEAEKGAIERDVARLFLFIATYEPEYSKLHMELAEYFLKGAFAEFELSKQKLLDEINTEAERMEERRKRKVRTETLTAIVERNFE